MAIEFKKQIAPTTDTTLYGHQSYDEAGFPKDAGNFKLLAIQKLFLDAEDSSIKTGFEFTKSERTYTLNYKGTAVASMELPPDRFLKSATFDASTKTLTLVFATETEDETVEIDFSSLIDTYTAGNGLALSGSVFSVKIPSSETRLKTDASGLTLDVSDITESIEQEATTRLNADTALDTRVTTLETNWTSNLQTIQESVASASASATLAGQNASKTDSDKTSASASATRANEYMASAKTYSETATEKAGVATTKATEASSSATSASASAKTAERFAKGTENGTAVTSGDGFEDNAKYYKELAKGYAESIDVSQFATKATTLAGYGITDGATKTEVDNISSSVAPLLYNNAGAHNAIYRGKSLGSTVTDAQWTAIGAGTFDGLYIGDYWTIGNITYRIAAFDYYYKAGDTSCETHHVTLVPDTSMYNHVMNDTDVATGAYVGSKMYKEGLAQAKTTISNAFGSAHILTHRQLLKNAITGNYESGHSWYDSTVELMTEQNVYGGKIFANHMNGGSWVDQYTIDKSQYPLFAFRPDMISNRQWYWLRDVSSASAFCRVGNDGVAGNSGASYGAGVRPAFSIKA